MDQMHQYHLEFVGNAESQVSPKLICMHAKNLQNTALGNKEEIKNGLMRVPKGLHYSEKIILFWFKCFLFVCFFLFVFLIKTSVNILI